MNYIQELSLSLIGRHKRGAGGWLNYNCPYCTRRGESRNDTKLRGGILITPVGGIKYNCFNCKFKAQWMPTRYLSKSIISYWKSQGADNNQINKAKLECLKLQESSGLIEDEELRQKIKDATPKTISTIEDLEELYGEAKLPEGAIRLEEAAEKYYDNTKFIQALKYIDERNPKLLEWYPDIYWTPSEKHNNYIIFPLKHSGILYGWTARRTKPMPESKMPRWDSDNKLKFLFNSDKLYSPFRDSIIITEGALDAIAVDGVALLGSEITPSQVSLINHSDKKIVVVPDRDKAGRALADIAAKHGWYVSFPAFDSGINDPFQAATVYGRMMTVRLILENATKCPMQIKAKAIDWFRG